MLIYELWEGTSGNLMATFDTEAEALAAVARRAMRYGSLSVDSLSLVAVDDEDEDADIVTVGSGAGLLARARREQPARPSAASGVSVHAREVGDA